ncbi:hypothetical protein PP485_gp46 [Gordonia phage ThankyouJordi]|uniref:Uncharacterized protein n=1 Tax=Gordonia phage ThankyouJordi TaxID=2571252 RepID=A0A4Y6EID9_9CAUD|nr:hypothetical protein PP485_gp46 [Gordonia phage ThankyouJordi]QCW22231.1 hypothetical protein SEA_WELCOMEAYANNA_46 [Gordonia phage WelcomeAyanna]QDF17807.1 hypothetical protein SEA_THANKYOUJORDI_46 [Gordonia phage ThankyouJordi]
MSASAEFVCEGCGARAVVAGAVDVYDLDDFGREWDDRHRECVPTIHEVVVACDSGCGREVTHHGVAATDANDAARIARERMAAEGWEEADGFHCRACLLARSGWQSQPGPSEAGRAMSVEAIRHQDRSGIVRALTADFTDHSKPGCGCGERDQGTPRPAVVAQAGAGGTASATNLPRN